MASSRVMLSQFALPMHVDMHADVNAGQGRCPLPQWCEVMANARQFDKLPCWHPLLLAQWLSTYLFGLILQWTDMF